MTSPHPPEDGGLGLTRVRDVLAVAAVAALAAYALVRLNYSALPALPRVAGASAGLIGIAEAAVAWGMWRRRRAIERDVASATPTPPLVAARLLLVAKASALAAGALGGIWLGALAYVAPLARRVVAAEADTVTTLIGVVAAIVMLGGALLLERACRVPRDEVRD